MKKFIWFMFFLLFFIITKSPSTSTETNNTIVIPLSTSKNLSELHSHKNLLLLASNSLIRARYLKQQNSKSFHSNIRVLPQVTGVMLFQLSFGIPQQTLHFELDTGSSLVWFPCGSNYVCHDCFPFIKQMTDIPTFDPSKSLSSKPFRCSTSKCRLFKSQSPNQCQSVQQNKPQNCSPFTYDQKYGLGSTTGVLLFESLNILKETRENFIVGCSSSSTKLLNGIAGFGRSNVSLPAQLGLTKFGYCLSSRWFDKEQHSYLALNSGLHVDLKYTPFHKNPSTHFRDYYYVVLESIIVDRKSINIPHKLLVPGVDGQGGTIVDSGTALTFFERSIFEAVSREFEHQMGKDTKVGSMGKIGLCFNVSHKKTHDLPKLSFQFRGGAVMNLSLDNHFVFRSRDIFCLAVMPEKSRGIPNGPAIILGSKQQQNFYMEYDLKNEKLGFRKDKCL